MWGAVAGGALGAIGGSMASSSSQNQVSGIRVAPETELEKQAAKSLQGGLTGFENVVNAGPGQQAATDYMKDVGGLRAMLQQFAGGGFLPGEQDFATANQYASQVFKPQQVMQQQQFEQQSQQANRLAAQLNRPVNDPIIQAKLRQQQMQQADVLGAQQTAFGAQFAQNLPMQRLGFTQQLADVSGNLASQAMSNRQALLSLGSTLREQDRAYRIATGERYGSQTTTSGGGLKGAIEGAIGGAGAGLGAQGMIQAIDSGAFGAGGAFGGPAKATQGATPSYTMPNLGDSIFGGNKSPQYGLGAFSRQSSLVTPSPAVPQAYNPFDQINRMGKRYY